jgi:hypothetical protein
MEDTQASTAELRLQLVRSGYTPIPLFGKAPPAFGKNNTKKGFADWQNLHDVTGEQIRMWGKTWPTATNTGILTKFTPTLDIDVLDADAASAVESYVREHFEERGHILPRVGKPPKFAIPFRTDQPFNKLVVNIVAPNGTSEKIEFLGDGQQVVVNGYHPETKQAYRWRSGEPGRIAREELPYIHEEEAEHLIAEIAELLIRDFGYQRAADRPRNRHKSNGGSSGKGFTITTGDGAADWKYLFDNIREGRELHDSLRDLAAKMIASGTAPGAVVNQLRGLMEGAATPHGDRWQERYEDIPRLVAGAEFLREEVNDDANSPKPDAGWSFHRDEAPAPTAWLVKHILPETGVSLISGQ